MSSEAAEQQPLLPAVSPASLEPEREEASGTTAGTTSGGSGGFRRNLGTVEAFAIAISIVIGSGIFTSPGSVDTNVPSPGAAMAVWLAGGVLVWTGAATMAELGTAIPGEGGVQPFLQYMYGDLLGFLAAWTWLVAVMPSTLAILSIVFVESLSAALGGGASAPAVVHKLLSVAVLALATLANSFSTRASARLNAFFVATKFLAIGAVVTAALVVVAAYTGRASSGAGDLAPDWTTNWFAARPTRNPDGSSTDWAHMSRWALLGHYSAALYGALWAYSGWDKVIYISAELSAPERQLPLAINTSLPVIVLCFLAANAAYYVLLPWEAVATTDSVAVTAFSRLLGPAFGVAAALVLCLVVAGALLSNSFVAGRMAVSAAHKQWIPASFARLGRLGRGGQRQRDTPVDKSDAPVNALVLAAGLATVYILLGNFRALLTFNGLGEFTFFFLIVLGAVVLRFREPGLARPYKPPLAVPALFAVASSFVVVRGAAFAPVQALVLMALWLLGSVYYYVRQAAA